MSNVNVSPEGLVPELGDIWTFVSTVYKNSFGKIIYRDGSKISIQQYNGSTTPVEFQLDPSTGFFLESLGVSEIICHEKRKDPHFSRQLGVVAGENLELYTSEGLPIDEGKLYTVARVIAEEDADAIILEDGMTLDFGFIGPPEGIGLITVAPAADATAENDAPPNADADVDIEADAVEPFPAFDESLLPAALVEEIPSEERMYSDTIQRTDMFTSLYMDIPQRKQKDPKVMARLYRITDLLLALKNSVVVRDATTAIILGQRESYIAETVEESLTKQPTGAPIASLLPVSAVKRVIFTDDVSEALADKGDVESRSDINSLIGAIQAASVYNSAEAAGNPFIAYINTLLKTIEVFKGDSSGTAKITVDQDVYRTVMPDSPLMGLKHVPSARDPRTNTPQPLFADRHLTEVSDRAVRLLAASRIRNPVTGSSYLVAPADSGETVGYVILDNTLSKYRSPTRSSVLLWDIQASEVSRKMTTLFGAALQANLEDQLLLQSGESTSLAIQLAERLSPSLNFMNNSNTTVLDGLGLRNLELNSDQFEALLASVQSGIKAWDSSAAALKKAAETRSAAEVAPAIKGIVDTSNPLDSEATFSDPTLKPVADAITENIEGTVLDGYDLVYANDLTKYANYSLGPYYYSVAAGGTDVDYLEKTKKEFLSEENRLSRNKATQLALSIEFQAEPELIVCPHVDDLEKVYGIQQDDKRMIALDKIIKKYNGGLSGNFINCGTCGNHLVCKHELLLVNEFFHPGRGVALHKALLLEFGNGVFEGAYICKNCGQKISELEYDTHIEFDDEGRPLVGRAVIETSNDDDGERVVIADETDAAIPFEDKVDKSIYKLARSMFERIGLQASEEMYKRVVPAARRYLEKIVPSERKYNKEREKALAAKKNMVEYKTYLSDIQAGVISALVLLEFQTSNIEVPLPIPGVEFSREGFPLDGDDWKVVGMAALDYVTFGLAGLFLNAPPWNSTTWAPVARDKDRIKMSKNAIVNGIFGILAMPTPAVPHPEKVDVYTDKYRRLLAECREKKKVSTAGTTAAGSASAADRLPPMYRPLQRSSGGGSAPAIGNKRAFLDQVSSGDFTTVAAAVNKRSHVLSQQIMNDFHKNAAASAIVIAGSPRSDSTCCFTKIGAAAATGLGIAGLGLEPAAAEELGLLGTAERILRARDPATSAAGTHIYVPWSAPYISTVLPAPKPEDYYKLFLKNCFAGNNMGLPHEYDPSNNCRHCGFEIPELLLYPRGAEIPSDASGKKRAEMLATLDAQYEAAAREALAEHVNVDEDTFKALEARVRERRQVIPAPPPEVVPFFVRLESMGATLGILLPPAAADWTQLQTLLASLDSEKVTDADERRGLLAPFATRYDALLAGLRTLLNTNSSDAERPFVDRALEALARITANSVGAVNARNISALFVVYGEQIATNYNNKDPKPTKWFVKMSRSHEELILRIWNNVAEITTKRLADLQRLDEKVNATIQLVLRRFTGWLGGMMNAWINEFRPSVLVHEKELTLMLRWTIVSGLTALLTSNSPLYADTPSPAARRTAARFLTAWVLDALITAGQRVDTYQLTSEQIAEKLNERAEAERAAFLKKFDDLDLDDRKVELIKKKLKIGDWSVGATKNLFAYDADMFEFERAQRAAFGVPEFDDGVTGIRQPPGGGEVGGELYGFRAGVNEGVNMHDNLFDADDGERM
jgi:hypothetical protein